MVDFLAIFFFIFGGCLGSFANVIIYRMPKGLSIVRPRSHCYSCQKTIAWYDNMPILSWFFLRGKCRHCKARFSIRYAAVEAIMAAVFLAIHLKYGLSWLALEYYIFSFGLITASFIDFDHMILPDEFTLGGIVVGLLGATVNPEREFLPALYGVLMGGGFLWAVAAIYAAVRKQEGMGGGDIKLLAWIGAVLGWTSVPFVILSSSVVGAVVGLILIARKNGNLQQAIPFGPYLALGAIFFFLGGSKLAQLYVHFFMPSL